MVGGRTTYHTVQTNHMPTIECALVGADNGAMMTVPVLSQTKFMGPERVSIIGLNDLIYLPWVNIHGGVTPQNGDGTSHNMLVDKYPRHNHAPSSFSYAIFIAPCVRNIHLNAVESCIADHTRIALPAM